MFEKILVPISSEYYSKEVIKRSVFLAKTFNSTVHILNILEENPLQQMEKCSDAHLTYHDRKETHQDLLYKQKQTADTIVLNDIQKQFKGTNIKMTHQRIYGEFSETVTNQVNKQSYDLIIIGFDRGCMINYSLIDSITIPLWIEGGGKHESILAVCSNLAPNQKVPKVSKKLAEVFKWKLSMLYITDTQDTVEVDTNGARSIKKPKHELLFAGQNFAEEMHKNQMNVKTVQGTLEQQTIKEANKIKAGLIIIGREQKEKGVFGLPVKKIKQKIAEKCKYSLLYLN